MRIIKKIKIVHFQDNVYHILGKHGEWIACKSQEDLDTVVRLLDDEVLFNSYSANERFMRIERDAYNRMVDKKIPDRDRCEAVDSWYMCQRCKFISDAEK